MNLLLFIALFNCADPSPEMAMDTATYFHVMEEYRSEAIASLWQSERQPILPEDTVHLHFYEPDIQYRIPCKLVRTPDEQPFEIATYSGQVREYITYARLEMDFEGRQFVLEVYRNSETLQEDPESDYLFLPFKDYTNGESTYGGGRYLNLSIRKLTEEGCIVDFNKAYNPWCAYRDGFHCPVPPSANHLSFEIKAGEKNFGKVR